MNKKLILIDGSSLLSTSFFGVLPREWHMGDKEAARAKMMQTADGRFTNGVYGMTKVLLKIIREHNPTHMSIAWDVSRNTFRRERYSEYKAQRKDTASELKMQFGIMQDLLSEMGLHQSKHETYEADDCIGTYAKRFETDLPVYVVTKDQDALQLIGNNTRVWLNTKKTSEMIEEFHGELPQEHYLVPDNFFEHTEQTIQHFYGLSPLQIIDLKALEGDTSDNIPGVKGVGPKAVIPLLKEFGTVEGIYEYIESHSDNEIKEFFKKLGISRSPLKNLREGKEMAFLSKELATINTNMAELLEMDVDDLIININEEKMMAKFTELEFKSFLKQKK